MTLTAIVGLAPPALGDDWRLIKGHVDERLTGAPPVNHGCLASCQVTAVGAGRATYLGRFTRLSCVVVREDGSPEGTTEFTAANGDKLCAEVGRERTSDSGSDRSDRARHLHFHWRDGPVQRRGGRDVFCGSYYLRCFRQAYRRRLRGNHTVLRGRQRATGHELSEVPAEVSRPGNAAHYVRRSPANA
jgi:hypothetical protein